MLGETLCRCLHDVHLVVEVCYGALYGLPQLQQLSQVILDLDGAGQLPQEGGGNPTYINFSE